MKNMPIALVRTTAACVIAVLAHSLPPACVANDREASQRTVMAVKSKIEGWLFGDNGPTDAEIILLATSVGERPIKWHEQISRMRAAVKDSTVRKLELVAYQRIGDSLERELPKADLEAWKYSIDIANQSRLLPLMVVFHDGVGPRKTWGNLVAIALVGEKGEGQPRIISLFTTPK